MSAQFGQQLRQARMTRSITLEQAAQATHLRVHYLTALEAGDLAAIPSLAQARGFMRIYAGYLGLESAALLSEMQNPDVLSSTEAVIAIPHSAPALGEQPIQPGAQIFGEIGAFLKERRKLLGLSLEDVERHTHLRRHYLQALEEGDLQNLPSPVQGRGMLSNYAAFLGMDPEPLMLRFAEALQVQLAARQATRPAAPAHPERPQRRPPGLFNRIFSAQMLLVVFSIIFLATFVVWAAIRIFAMQSQVEASATAPSIASVLLSPPTETATPSPQPPTPTLPLAAPAASLQPQGTEQPTLAPGSALQVQVYITIRQRAWMRVTVDGKIEFEGRVIPGTAYQYVGEESVEILTGNGAAVQIFFNQQDLGLLGISGQVVNRVYSLDGVLFPTPTITLTPNPVPRSTLAPQGTSAP